jgi:hypothetical protein
MQPSPSRIAGTRYPQGCLVGFWACDMAVSAFVVEVLVLDSIAE